MRTGVRSGRRRWRRRETALVGAGALVVALGLGGVSYVGRDRVLEQDLYLDTMAVSVSVDASGTVHQELRPVPATTGDDALLPGSRVLRPAADASAAEVTAADAEATAQRDWLAAGTVPGAGTADEDMARDALLDLHVMTADDGAVLAAGSGPWQYAWPRDGAFAAVAFARTGHLDDARRVLAFFQRAQERTGDLEARYLPDGSGSPDGRARQLDGNGWLLWALGEVVDAAPVAQQAGLLDDFASLRHRSEDAARAALQTTGRYAGLPRVSPDYWEKKETKPTLGTAAALLAGLRAAERLEDHAGDTGRSARAGSSAATLAAAIDREFGPDYGRYPGSDRRDAAVAFLLPPFAATADPAVVSALGAAADQMARPAGGLAPGADWHDDGVSWTPETAAVALGAASAGDDDLARRLVDFLATHRTAAGSMSEKVLFDGRPAGTAPLVWSEATTLLVLDALDDEDQLDG
ncbi:glycoside hydrolase family 15 [Luteimicrobium subarcticum]|uniref:Glucoamylase n=1 Tax=Luteimicrobium subarcticum TaxID=620910 RepID=A0A2M8WRR4_9MICO|nr:glycoside hydrolase family 15 [Luteimicrobium subarcticum]PJI93619.1 hypothetical protein CLV34_1092 [Luteimicrobium subarcticum]